MTFPAFPAEPGIFAICSAKLPFCGENRKTNQAIARKFP
jgi:hypothetical protein